jgi:hypothetical protein
MDEQLEDIQTEYIHTINALHNEDKRFNEEYEKLTTALRELFISNEKNKKQLKAKAEELHNKFYKLKEKLGVRNVWLSDKRR